MIVAVMFFWNKKFKKILKIYVDGYRLNSNKQKKLKKNKMAPFWRLVQTKIVYALKMCAKFEPDWSGWFWETVDTS